MPRTAQTKAAMPTTAYEQSRTERIRMLQQQMNGVLQASKELRATVEKQPQRKAVRTHRKPAQKLSVPTRDMSSRRSGRLAGQEAIHYNEDVLAAVDGVLHSSNCVRATAAPLSGQWGVASRRPELYNDDHVSALGSATEEWTLFVDGYCPSTGKRVYDKVDGVTCHQCRQKTLGKRTSCSQCQSLFGNFCGDCLYMRYGENINEAAANPEWICPCCRDFCNCSFHRSRAGWAPTGTMYRRAQADGYLSVAHCLILNNLEPETLKRIVASDLSVPGGYPQEWATEHGAPFPPVAARVAAVTSDPGALVSAVSDPVAVEIGDDQQDVAPASSSQSSHSACTGEQLDDLQVVAAAPTAVTSIHDPIIAPATRKGKKPSPCKPSAQSSQNKLTSAKKPIHSAAAADASIKGKDRPLAVAIPVRKGTRARGRRSLAGKVVDQPALPPAAGGSVADAWLSTRH